MFSNVRGNQKLEIIAKNPIPLKMRAKFFFRFDRKFKVALLCLYQKLFITDSGEFVTFEQK